MAVIYKITNLKNGKVYVGKTHKTYIGRMKEHLKSVNGPKCKQLAIHRAIVKYGLRWFDFKIIEYCDPDIASEREMYWIDFYNSYKEGYNNTLGGDGKNQYDHREILRIFDECKYITETARIAGCSIDLVSELVKNSGRKALSPEERSDLSGTALIAKDKSGKKIKDFTSFAKANEWLINNFDEASRINPKDPTPIRRSMKKQCGFPKGVIYWEYKTGPKYLAIDCNPVTVNILKDGNIVQACKSYNDTARHLCTLANKPTNDRYIKSVARRVKRCVAGTPGYKTCFGYTLEKV